MSKSFPPIENKQAVGGTQPAPPEYAPGEKELDYGLPRVRVTDSKQPIKNPTTSLKKR
jgi:hypothetical protein